MRPIEEAEASEPRPERVIQEHPVRVLLDDNASNPVQINVSVVTPLPLAAAERINHKENA